jgi:predicted O-methyltransferase YrrM
MDLRHWSRALSSLARHGRDKEFVKQLLNSGLKADARPGADGTFILKAFPELRGLTVPMGDVTYTRSNMDPLEQYFLAAIASKRRPRTIFEIGTFDGATTLLLARAAPEAQVFTLDLPPDSPALAALSESRAAPESAGSRFRDAPEAGRITQLFGDSREYDFSPYHGKMDLVIVDGGHTADCVTPDSENALKMVAPAGVVVWDDYEEGWPSVIGSVDAVALRHGLSLVRLEKTGLAVYDSSRAGATGGAGLGTPRAPLTGNLSV